MKAKMVTAVVILAVHMLCCVHSTRAAEEIPQEMSLATANILIKNQRVLAPVCCLLRSVELPSYGLTPRHSLWK